MRNAVQDGRRISIVAAAAQTSGELVLVGSLHGFASNTVAAGAANELAVEGVYSYTKSTAVGSALVQGAPVYSVDEGSGLVLTGDAAAGVNAYVGTAWAAAADADTLGYVKLAGSAPKA